MSDTEMETPDRTFICINLERRPDRKAVFLNSYKDAGLDTCDLHWLTAVDGRTLPESRLAGFRHNPRQPLANKLGRLACYLSHISAIEKAIEINVWPAVIFEDDVMINSRIHHALDTLPSRALGILYLGALPIVNKKCATLSHTGWATPGDVKLYGAHAYCFADVLQAILFREYARDHPWVFDSIMVQYQKHVHHGLVFHPFAASQSFGDSDIDVIKP